MFETLGNKLSAVFEKLKRRGALSESDVTEALREVRIALLEADVALPVVKDFIESVKAKAIGQEVVRSVTPGQMVVKIVHDHLVEILGGEVTAEINLNTTPPAVILMVGLQGSGKTTSSAKLGLRLKDKLKKKVLLASLDIYRPAAQEQLAILGRQTDIATLPIVKDEKPAAITRRALDMGRKEGFDVIILDTAGRLHIDEALMAEVAEVKNIASPVETLLTADAMTGQDAVTIASQFNEKIGITGLILTRIDGDARGGAALSMRHVTGMPVKFVGLGEKIDAFEPFHPQRIAGRILGMGDVVSLVEKAAELIEKEDAEKLAAKMAKGQFDLEDLLGQLRQLKKMGDLKGIMGMLPGVGKIKKQLDEAKIDDKILARQEAIILSMTPKERKNPDILKASRKQRIAKGAGVAVQEINRLLKQHQQMATMMKQFSKMGQKGVIRQGLQSILPKWR